jgi:hypothetical protein
MEYITVFDITKEGYKAWTFVTPGVLFVFIGALMLRFNKYLPMYPIKSLKFKKAFSICFLAFAAFWTSTSFFGTYSGYRNLSNAFERGHVQVTEGIVENFIPMPYSGHSKESFTVNGVKFSYSDYIITPGFNNTASHGGPIKSDLQVRIWHAGNRIAKLEIASGKKP